MAPFPLRGRKPEGGSVIDLRNYRLIFKQPVFVKLFEHLINVKIVNLYLRISRSYLGY